MEGGNNMSEVKVKKIDFVIGDKEISLTPDEAKRLHDVLCDIFDKEIIIKPDPQPADMSPHNPFPTSPVVYPNPFYPNGFWYCSHNSSSFLSHKNGVNTTAECVDAINGINWNESDCCTNKYSTADGLISFTIFGEEKIV